MIGKFWFLFFFPVFKITFNHKAKQKERHVTYLEEQILNQINIVTLNQQIPIYIQKNTIFLNISIIIYLFHFHHYFHKYYQNLN